MAILRHFWKWLTKLIMAMILQPRHMYNVYNIYVIIGSYLQKSSRFKFAHLQSSLTARSLPAMHSNVVPWYLVSPQPNKNSIYLSHSPSLSWENVDMFTSGDWGEYPWPLNAALILPMLRSASSTNSANFFTLNWCNSHSNLFSWFKHSVRSFWAQQTSRLACTISNNKVASW